MDQNRSDFELLSAFEGSADQAGFGQLVERYLPLVLRVARRRVIDPNTADDVAQAVFFCLARKARKVSGRDVAGWLVRATALASKEAMRKRARRQHHERLAVFPASPLPPVPDTDVDDLLIRALLRLSAADRCAVMLRFYRDLTYPQIAQQIGCNEDAARKRVERSLARMHDWLEPHAMQLTPAAIAPILGTWAHHAGGIPASICAAAATSGQISALQLAIARGLLKALSLTQLAIVASAALLISVGSATAIALAAQAPPGDPTHTPTLRSDRAGTPAAAGKPTPPGQLTADVSPQIPPVPYPLPTQLPTARPITQRLLDQWLTPVASVVLGAPPCQHPGYTATVLPMRDGSLLSIGGSLNDLNGQRCGHYFIVRWDPGMWQPISLNAGLGAATEQVAAAADGSTALISFPNWFDQGRHGGYMKFIDLVHGGELAPSVYSSDSWYQPLAVSPDGRTGYCCMTGGNTLMIWDMRSGKVRQEVTTPGGYSVRLLADPLARFVAIGTLQGDDNVHVYQFSDRSWHTLRGHHNTITTMAVSPDGQLLASGSEDCTVKLWDLNAYKLAHTLRGHNAGITALAFSPDGTTLASSAGRGSTQTNENGKVGWKLAENSLRVWRVTDGVLIGGGELPDSYIRHLAFSPDGATLLASNSIQMEFAVDSLLRSDVTSLLPPKAGVGLDEVRTIETSGKFATSCALAQDGSSLTVALFRSLERIDLPGYAQHVIRATDQNTIAIDARAGAAVINGSTGDSGDLICSDLATGDVRWSSEGFDAHTARISPDGAKLAAVAGKFYQPNQGLAMRPRSELRILDQNSGRTLLNITDVRDSANAIAFAPDGKRLYVGSGRFEAKDGGPLEYLDCAIEAFDTTRDKRLVTFEAQSRPVTALCVHPTGNRIYASTNAGITAFDTATGKATSRCDVGAEITCLDTSPDGRYIAAGDTSNNINVFDATTLKMLARDDRAKNITTLVRFLANDTFLSSSFSEPMRVWQISDGQRTQETRTPTP